MERKKITFDSFIRGVILGVIIIGILMLLKRLSSVLLAKVKEQDRIHILRIIGAPDCRCRSFLSVSSPHDTGVRQSTGLIGSILFARNIQQQCANLSFRILTG